MVHSQNNRNVTDSIANNFHELTENQALDNIYLQTSKDIYETKEDLWFKAYILNAQFLIPSQSSKTLFVQLINNETINDPFPDYRNSVFWEPDIITKAKGVARIEFYCSDINTIFTGAIEGFSGTGSLGTEDFNFKVNKKRK